MFSGRDETECHKLVTYYVIYTSIYFSFILFFLFFTNGIYTVGKYNFQATLIIIAFAELLKYFSGVVYIMRSDFNLIKKPENVSLLTVVQGFFTAAKMREGFKNMVIVFGTTMIYFGFAVLYGAEIFDKYEETFMFSSLIAMLTILPVCINLGSYTVILIALGYKPNDKLEHLIYQNFYITVLGAWLGAFVIPLDWDRPWQKWPIPCSCGAMIGFLASHILMIFHLRGIQFKGNWKF